MYFLVNRRTKTAFVQHSPDSRITMEARFPSSKCGMFTICCVCIRLRRWSVSVRHVYSHILYSDNRYAAFFAR